MKRFNMKGVMVAATAACVMVFSGCAQNVLQMMADEVSEEQSSTESTTESSIITDYNWRGTPGDSLIVCEQDGTFKFYRYADDLTDNYFEGTYEFCMGEDAVDYITTTLSSYSVTEDELQQVFDNNEEYDESNFVCFVLNNEKCIVEGENTIDEPYQTPYFGFCLEEDGVLSLDIANMNTGNYSLYVAE